jgi:RNA polymerase sigma-70 factor (ECF subfamily)
MEIPGDNFKLTEIAAETDLMRRAGRGERSAFSEVIQIHQQRVWNTAFRFTQRAADADDITQEAFMRLWNAAPRWEPAARLSTWLYRVVANLCVDLRRKEVKSAGTLQQDVAEKDSLMLCLNPHRFATIIRL